MYAITMWSKNTVSEASIFYDLPFVQSLLMSVFFSLTIPRVAAVTMEIWSPLW